ncbi:dipeptidyl-peptidase 3 family protein [Flavilitoribacter nigricans]|uniref:Zn-dependent hydrolase n=1 Tax=Flavilitoribacter nigricans (strain ATCC 23147 / DSM 23189 / NBRC 102662 / NCIMB 1420 / SS-2) TaxID=1122177 RepID=A0A2D0NJQ1_FLAN2|nr:Zn-dependent hydrolase [Flavilitoribacter nigricans]PHN07963.1 Zn-dependent hydrolase [Flavilitoribacter nigricans DSM 23189 = NBRC 102662]
MYRIAIYLFAFSVILTAGCAETETPAEETPTETDVRTEIEKKIDQYATVRLSTDLSKLTDKQKEMIAVLIDAGKIMNDLFWYEAYGDKGALMEQLKDPLVKRYAEINYGPWDRLDGNEPFVAGIGAKPAGANFYPEDMTKKEFEMAELPEGTSLYTFVRRKEDGSLYTIPYHQQFAAQVQEASDLLKKAADLADNAALKKYLLSRAEAFLNDDYQPSDMDWMDMKDNQIDVVIGPIENYEDNLYNYKAAHEAYVLVKDMEWSERLAKYAAFLPELQRGLPVPDQYKAESPGTDSELNAYDVVFYAGDCNSGSKTIAINLPNDEEVQAEKGSRRLQLKNAMRAKFDKILVPISEVLIAPEQRQHITFDAFFANTMFHEVAHGLGIKNVVNGSGTVRKALEEHSSALEEGKADILGLYMIKQLHDKGELDGDLHDYYVTFMAGIFRSVRFGAASAHGKANMIRFNFFKEKDAFRYDEATGQYAVDFEKFEAAVTELSRMILTLQGDGDYDGVARLVAEKGVIGSGLQSDLDRLSDQNIPVDIVFEQGVEVLGL